MDKRDAKAWLDAQIRMDTLFKSIKEFEGLSNLAYFPIRGFQINGKKDQFVELAKAVDAEVVTDGREDDMYPTELSFTYNGKKFYTLVNEEDL